MEGDTTEIYSYQVLKIKVIGSVSDPWVSCPSELYHLFNHSTNEFQRLYQDVYNMLYYTRGRIVTVKHFLPLILSVIAIPFLAVGFLKDDILLKIIGVGLVGVLKFIFVIQTIQIVLNSKKNYDYHYLLINHGLASRNVSIEIKKSNNYHVLSIRYPLQYIYYYQYQHPQQIQLCQQVHPPNPMVSIDIDTPLLSYQK